MEKNAKNEGAAAVKDSLKINSHTEAENLGLDADHSSENPLFSYLNNDNDRISHNPDGESDDSDNDEGFGHSPLTEK